MSANARQSPRFHLPCLRGERFYLESCRNRDHSLHDAFSETANNEKPGGSASAFCAPVSITSMPSASISMFTAENDETVSTTSATSGYLARTRQISSSGFITPVDVSLWISVTVSNFPVAKCRSTAL